MAYRAPIEDIIFTLKHAAGFAGARADGLYQDLGDDDLDAVLGEAGRFASEVLAPLNAPGDRYGTPFRDGEVTTPPGWKEAYRDWAAAGWNGVAAPAEWGGQSLPRAVNAACIEMWNSAAMAFGIVGKKAGSVPGYAYTNAFKTRANWEWTEDAIGGWMMFPSTMVPGTAMGVFQGIAEKDRDDLVAYLGTLK